MTEQIPLPHDEKPLEPSRRDVLRMGLAGLAAVALQPLHEWLPAWQQGANGPLKRIYLAPDDHTDLFWTANDASYREAFVRMIDYYLDLADETENLPVDFQSRWNCDGSYWAWVYERAKPDADFQRLISRFRDGHMNMPLNSLVVNQGGAPAEAILRGMYYAGQLERRFDLRFPIAISMENQTLPLGQASLWAGAGAMYSWKGICGCDTLVQAAIREREVYWAEGLDGQRVLLKWNSRIVDNKGIGGYAEARDPAGIVEFVENDGGFLARYPYQVVGAFGKGWDDFETMTDEFVHVAQEKSNDQRRVIVSNQKDFFADFEATYGSEIPSAALSFGNDWDLYCAALAEVTAQVKRAIEGLRSAESLAVLATRMDPNFMKGRESARDLAWMDLGLFWEHNFGVAGRDDFMDERIAWQRQLASEISAYVDQLRDDAAAIVAAHVQQPGDERRVLVFNPLSWSRTDVVDLPLDSADSVTVVDLATGEELRSQRIQTDGQDALRVFIANVPAFGYKAVALRPGSGTRMESSVVTGDGMIETSLYRVVVDGTGAITSLVDKRDGEREWIRPIGGLAANDLGGDGGTVTVENAGSVSATLVATGETPLAHTTRVTLIEGVDRVEIANHIQQNFNDAQTWTFSFDMDAPDLWHEELGAILRARLASDGGHYSAQNARYDWLTLNHFADLSSQGGQGITLSNADCLFVRFGGSTPEQLDVSTPQLEVLAGGRVGGDGRFGIPDQGGDSEFNQRFALRTRPAMDSPSAMRFALEHQNPLLPIPLPGNAPDPAVSPQLPETSYGLIQPESDQLLVWALKPADDLDGETVIRVWNLGQTRQDLTFSAESTPIASIRGVTHIETPIAAGSAEASGQTLQPQQMRSFAVRWA
ncbi:MAG: glycoside hydrolase [Anaerolineae bacterium]